MKYEIEGILRLGRGQVVLDCQHGESLDLETALMQFGLDNTKVKATFEAVDLLGGKSPHAKHPEKPDVDDHKGDTSGYYKNLPHRLPRRYGCGLTGMEERPNGKYVEYDQHEARCKRLWGRVSSLEKELHRHIGVEGGVAMECGHPMQCGYYINPDDATSTDSGCTMCNLEALRIADTEKLHDLVDEVGVLKHALKKSRASLSKLSETSFGVPSEDGLEIKGSVERFEPRVGSVRRVIRIEIEEE